LQIVNLFSVQQPTEVSLDCELLGGELLKLTDIVRTVPNKRWVCKGEWNGQAVFAKFFSGKRNQYYAARDANGVKALLAANILTPKLLAQRSTQDGKAEVLIFEALAPAENCEVLWKKSAPPERLMLAKKMCVALAKHHAANLLQTDLYFKNFLYFQEDIYTLDGDGIRQFNALNPRVALDNLAVLLSKMDVLEVAAWGEALLSGYHQANQKFSFSFDALHPLSKKFRMLAVNKYAKKIFRNCTDVEIKKSMTSFLAFARPEAEILQNISVEKLDDMMREAKILKNGRTCTVALSVISGKKCVIKRYNMKHAGHFLWRMLRKTRAANSWEHAHRLTLLGLHTAQPLALLEQRLGGLNGKAYFMCEFVDAPDIKEFFRASTDKAQRATVVKNAVQLLYRIYLLKISHGDFKANNLKIVNGQPLLIDLDSMRQHCYDFFAEKAHVRDLKRFMQNWKDDTSLYNAFLKTFKVVYEDHAVLKKARLLIED
jgi:tRNA A-37 threonylcarbamoyl transferase component Bud32